MQKHLNLLHQFKESLTVYFSEEICFFENKITSDCLNPKVVQSIFSNFPYFDEGHIVPLGKLSERLNGINTAGFFPSHKGEAAELDMTGLFEYPTGKALGNLLRCHS